MAWDEARAWLAGVANGKLYQNLLDDATDAAGAQRPRKKIVIAHDMPWEMSPQGLLKHLVNAQMNARMETVDAYMQIIPPGQPLGQAPPSGRGGLYVVEGRGYDLHEDCDVEITDNYTLEAAGRDQALRVGSRRHHLHPALHDSSALQRRSGRARRGSSRAPTASTRTAASTISSRSKTRRNTIPASC